MPPSFFCLSLFILSVFCLYSTVLFMHFCSLFYVFFFFLLSLSCLSPAICLLVILCLSQPFQFFPSVFLLCQFLYFFLHLSFSAAFFPFVHFFYFHSSFYFFFFFFICIVSPFVPFFCPFPRLLQLILSLCLRVLDWKRENGKHVEREKDFQSNKRKGSLYHQYFSLSVFATLSFLPSSLPFLSLFSLFSLLVVEVRNVRKR